MIFKIVSIHRDPWSSKLFGTREAAERYLNSDPEIIVMSKMERDLTFRIEPALPVTPQDAIIGRYKPRTGDQLFDEEEAAIIIERLTAAGYVIVPKEPTREMWAAGADACVTKVNVHHDKVVGDVWGAMLKASADKRG